MTYSTVKFLLAVCGALVLSGCDELQSVETRHTVHSIGFVRAIDREDRTIKLVVDFSWVKLKIAPEVTAFDTVKVGDFFHVRYRHAATVRQLPPGKDLKPLETQFELSPPENGKPGNGLVRNRQITARFVDFDHQSKLTTLQLADGSYTLFLASGRFESLATSLSLGDRIEVFTEEAIAVSVDPL